MTIGAVQIIANGSSTDHPVPGLAFVDDAHIPVDDPDAIEDIGRGKGYGRHGRRDSTYGADEDLQWWAATTEPDGTDLAWCVRYHPKHGHSVVLVRSEDPWTLHEDWSGSDGPLLFRSGGYWWDGATWYRPMQVFDWASQRFMRRRVPGATSITAADILALDDDPTGGSASVLTIADVHNAAVDGAIQPMIVGNWADHLQLWAGRRRTSALPLSRCIVDLSAPELAADQLIGTPELAAQAGIAASTLRAYSARGENDLPTHQAIVGGRKMWSRPVGADWAENRNRLPDSVAAALAGSTELSVGQIDLRDRFTTKFFNRIWSSTFRKQWRLKDEQTARQRAAELASVVATNVDDIIPVEALRHTVCAAVLGQFRKDVTAGTISPEKLDYVLIPPRTGKILDWLVRHHPWQAATAINDIIGAAKTELGLPPDATSAAIRRTLNYDGKLARNGYDAYLDRVLPPPA
ncbi:hypothetical protein [Mycolicibacterium fortuitum]|uniref:Uncharacterized protein n=1 Tax=Mycolicibacterium fortuitum TaxID=1766 RepID=A0AAE4VD58_MYCFO|nr:hypothetical protein [Mycolicibacterium fortuitum]MDV7193308.1 hypothetical protein [Mycolicibacterium fortuitum]MDV7206011.1 hypothetical protein [Mycolicibacterium fortuitum]MDV7227424.1 hypothetical protein [Mycolicibacterium fortuitum]MDV7259879.1 hypothetical protein [Mycolicibacterium fortuitum]MDV7286028.1 hypothetical protein [Mycolicibacterium fortuitum]